MNNRKATIIKLATCYGVLYGYYKIAGELPENEEFLEGIFDVLDYYVYNKNSKESDKLVQAIQEINKSGEHINSSAGIVLSLLNQIIEDDLLYTKNERKRANLRLFQEKIINHKDYNKNAYNDFDAAEELNELINKSIKKYC